MRANTMGIASNLIADFDREAAYTRKMIQAVPEDKYTWQPHRKSWTMAQLVGHIAESPSWLGAIFDDEMDFGDMPEYQPFQPETKAQAEETLERNLASFSKLLGDKDDAFLQGTWTMRKGDKVLMKAPRSEVIRETLIHHLAHHRGQLSVYLRLVDAPVPATYGGTADEEFF